MMYFETTQAQCAEWVFEVAVVAINSALEFFAIPRFRFRQNWASVHGTAATPPCTVRGSLLSLRIAWLQKQSKNGFNQQIIRFNS